MSRSVGLHMRRWAVPLAALTVCAAPPAGPVIAAGANPPPATRPATAAADDELVRLNLAEGIPLRVLIDYVSQEFGVNVLYDDQAVNRSITIKAPDRLPRAALWGLLESALKANGLALVDADQPGWKRVVPLQQAARPAEAPFREPPKDAALTAVLTQVFRLDYVNPQQIDAAVKPFLSGPAATSTAVEGQGLLIVTDYASNVSRIAELIRAIDQPAQQVGIEFIDVKFADASRVTQQLEQLLRARVRAAGGGDRAAAAVETAYDARTNQVVVIAPKDRMDDARQIVAELDVAVPEAQSPVRFYKLANATAVDVLATIRALEGEGPDRTGPGRPSRPSPTGTGRDDVPYYPDSTGGPTRRSPGMGRPGGDRRSTPPDRAPSNDVRPPRSGAALPPSPAASLRQYANAGGVPVPESPGPTPPGGPASPSLAPSEPSSPDEPADAGPARPEAKVTADPNTNSIIVVGPPDVQRLYEQLIRTLDKRRPQVLIEATIVTIDTSGDFRLGVEIGRQSGTPDNQVITFSSFGLSTPNPATGRLTLVPGAGFNGALISSDIADVVLRALEGSNRARVTSAPRILVNDNSVGTLTSIVQFPYASVNASDTVATTSFGNYAEAGTQITVTPHISEADYLQLEYVVSLSSFTGEPVQQADVLLPPPRKEDTVESAVTIPDGATIVVGGLNRRNNTDDVDRVPLLGRIPIVEFLFSNRVKTESTSTLFVFLRPIILRDDRFEDLKYLSERDAREAAVPADFPPSEPLAIP